MGSFVNIDVKMLTNFPAVHTAMNKATREALKNAAAYTRTTAARLMKPREDSSGAQWLQEYDEWRAGKRAFPGGPRSKPGDPPKASPRTPYLKSRMAFAMIDSMDTAVVGPLATGSAFADVLEHGGRMTKRNQRRRIRKVGGSGEIWFGTTPPRHGTNAPVIRTVSGGHAHVWYAPIKTQKQADRANRINEALFGDMEYTVNMEARPFMEPALEKASGRMDKFFDRVMVKYA